MLPIPPGTHWSEAKPLVLPAQRGLGILPEPETAAPRERSGETPKPRKKDVPPVRAKPVPLSGALFFAPPAPEPSAAKEKLTREKKPKAKNDPKLVSAARELRDRYLEHVNGEQANERLLMTSRGKYDVSRVLQSATRNPQSAILSLPAAA
ncbi:MAG: hypothetical protein WBD40_07875 [Tepidisphaeraceae bacterium]